MEETITNFLEEVKSYRDRYQSFIDELRYLGLNFYSIEFDTSHDSIKITGVPLEQTLSKELKEFLCNNGFFYVYFVHTNGWITPYIIQKEISIGGVPFAEEVFSYQVKEDEFEERLLDMGLNFYKIFYDGCDYSIKITGVPNEQRLSKELQKFLKDNEFNRVYLEHDDGWETHYLLKKYPAEGWRVRYPDSSPTNELELEKPHKDFDEHGIRYKLWNKEK